MNITMHFSVCQENSRFHFKAFLVKRFPEKLEFVIGGDGGSFRSVPSGRQTKPQEEPISPAGSIVGAGYLR